MMNSPSSAIVKCYCKSDQQLSVLFSSERKLKILYLVQPYFSYTYVLIASYNFPAYVYKNKPGQQELVSHISEFVRAQSTYKNSCVRPCAEPTCMGGATTIASLRDVSTKNHTQCATKFVL